MQAGRGSLLWNQALKHAPRVHEKASKASKDRLYGRGQTFDSQIDPRGRLDSETQPHLVPRTLVKRTGIADFSGNIHHLFGFRGTMEEFAVEPGLDLFGQSHPDIQPTVRMHPFNSVET